MVICKSCALYANLVLFVRTSQTSCHQWPLVPGGVEAVCKWVCVLAFVLHIVHVEPSVLVEKNLEGINDIEKHCSLTHVGG